MKIKLCKSIPEKIHRTVFLNIIQISIVRRRFDRYTKLELLRENIDSLSSILHIKDFDMISLAYKGPRSYIKFNFFILDDTLYIYNGLYDYDEQIKYLSQLQDDLIEAFHAHKLKNIIFRLNNVSNINTLKSIDSASEKFKKRLNNENVKIDFVRDVSIWELANKELILD